MSSERYSLYHCLTEQGWVMLDEDAKPPNNWLRICELEVYEGSPFGQESRKWKESKTNPDRTTEEADALELIFPRPSTAPQPPSPELLKFFENNR